MASVYYKIKTTLKNRFFGLNFLWSKQVDPSFEELELTVIVTNSDNHNTLILIITKKYS